MSVREIGAMSTWMVLSTYLNQWGAFFSWFSQFTAFELALLLLPVTVLSRLVLVSAAA